MVSEIRSKKKMKNLEVVDLFCGVGGLTHGLLAEGLNVVAGIDFDQNCGFPFESNNPGAKFINQDIGTTKHSEILNLYSENSTRVLIGCAPCQPFSTYSRSSRKNSSDNRWTLLHLFGKLVKKTNPHIVSMENVPQLLHHNIFSDFVKILNRCGYHVSEPTIAYCPDYGVPQHRKRLVLIASKMGTIELVQPSEFNHKTLTVREAIGHLPRIKAGSRDKSDKLHRCSNLSDINYDRIKCSKPGDTWREWPENLIADCHKKEQGATYPAVYGRMEWDKPSPTITTQFFGYGNGRFGHPRQNRAISLREGAILQSFPEKYKFEDANVELSFQAIGRLIGNAVPVNLARAIGKTIRLHVEHYNQFGGATTS